MCKLAQGLIFVALSWPAAVSAQNPFAGTWKTVPLKNPTATVTYSFSAAGREHYSNNRNSEYDFAIDGKEYPTDRPASTVTWNKTGQTSWSSTEKISGRVTREIHLALSSDGQTLTTTYTWFNPGNRTAQGSTIFSRVSGGPGLEGTWKMVKRVEEPDTLTIAFPVPGQMYIYVDPIDNTWAGPMDGTFMAVQSPVSPPGMTSAYRIAGPRKMTFEAKYGDRIIFVGTLEVSDDGKTLMRTTWAPGKEDNKTVLILEKLAATSCSGAAGCVFAAKSTLDTRKIADAVKADAAQYVLDFNAHDAVRAAGHDAPDVLVMEGGSPNVSGATADLAGFKKGFASDPTSKIALIDEAVDLAASGDMAIYRAIFVHSWTRVNTPVTRKINFLAVYKPQVDGSWKIQSYVLSGMEPAQPVVATKNN